MVPGINPRLLYAKDAHLPFESPSWAWRLGLGADEVLSLTLFQVCDAADGSQASYLVDLYFTI